MKGGLTAQDAAIALRNLKQEAKWMGSPSGVLNTTSFGLAVGGVVPTTTGGLTYTTSNTPTSSTTYSATTFFNQPH